MLKSAILGSLLILFYLPVQSQEGMGSAAKVGARKALTALVFGKKELTLKARAQGELMEIRADEGQRVKAKDVIAVIDNRRVKIDLDLTKVEYQMAKKDFESSKKLKKYVSSDEIVQKEGAFLKKKSAFEAKSLDLINTQILAPTDGIVTKKYFEVGESVSVGEKVFEMVQLDELILIANVPSEEATHFKLNAKAKFRVEEIKGQTFDAVVSFVSPVIDAASDTVRVKLAAKNKVKDGTKEFWLKPGMLASLEQ